MLIITSLSSIFLIIFIGLFIYYFKGLLHAFLKWWHEQRLIAIITLMISFSFVIFPIIYNWSLKNSFSLLERMLYLWLLICIFYLLLAFIVYVLASYTMHQKVIPNQKYIIILGAGLLHGNQISSILAARLDAGIRQHQKVTRLIHVEPLIICSGGQGHDETEAESKVMRAYVIQHGVNPKNVIAETHSKNTLQNMQFTKQILKRRHLHLTTGVYATSDYHLLRAGIYARRNGLDILGVGSKTNRLFLPYVVIREYVALIRTYKGFHILMVFIMFSLSLCFN